MQAAAENGFKRPVPQAKVPKSTNKFRVPGGSTPASGVPGGGVPASSTPSGSTPVVGVVEGDETGATGVASEPPPPLLQQPEQPHNKKPGSGAGGSGADTRGLPMNPFEITKAKTLKQSKKE